MTDPSPTPPPTAGEPLPAFARAWRWLLPTAIAVLAASLVLGVFDATARPAWVFVAGVFVGLAGVASLGWRLIVAGRREAAEIGRRIENDIEETRRP